MFEYAKALHSSPAHRPASAKPSRPRSRGGGWLSSWSPQYA